MAEAIAASGNAYQNPVSARLIVSSRHLCAAVLGEHLEPIFQHRNAAFTSVLPIDHATVITAAQTLVFGDAMASLDLCASAAFYWSGIAPTKVDREFDLGFIAKPTWAPQLPPWVTGWHANLLADGRWTTVEQFRHAQIHRLVRRSTKVGGPGGPEITLSPSSQQDPDQPVENVYANVNACALEHWRIFWQTLVANP